MTTPYGTVPDMPNIPPPPPKKRGLAVSRESDGSESAVERWECNYCGKGAPCIVEIHFTRTPYPHVEAQSRFRKRTCVCGESHVTDWKQIQNDMLTVSGGPGERND